MSVENKVDLRGANGALTLSSSDNGDKLLVNGIEAGTGPATRVGLDVRDFSPPAVGGNISAALTAALAAADAVSGALIDLRGLPAGTYLLGGVTINKPNITLMCAQHVILAPPGNVDMLTIGALAQNFVNHDLHIEGNGGVFATARGVVVSGQAGSMKLLAPRIIGMGGYCLAFTAAGAGSRFQCSDAEFGRYLGADGEANSGSAAIYLIGDGGLSTNRKFVNVSVNGYIATVEAGNENTSFISGVGNNFNFLGRANKFYVIGMRLTPLTALTVTFNILSGVIMAESIAGAVVIGGTSADSIIGPFSCVSVTCNAGTGDPVFALPNTIFGAGYSQIIDNGNNRVIGGGGDTPNADALVLTGAVGNYAKAIDSAALSIVGDIEFRAKVAMTSWVPGSNVNIINKWDPAGGNGKSYIFGILSSGKINLYWNDIGGTSHFPDSGTAVGFAPGQTKWIRATLDVDNGAGGNTTTFYTSDDGVTWVQLGSPVIAAGVTTILDSAAAVEIGSQDHGTTGNFNGKIFRAQILGSLGGAAVADFNPRAVGIRGTRQPTLHIDAPTVQWVMQGSAWDWGIVERDAAQNGGTATFSGNGVLTSFAIPHKLQATPRIVHVNPAAVAANGISFVTADATNVTVTYAVAPANASNNVVLWWEAKL